MTGVVIVTWNSAAVIGQCLDACLRFPDLDIVVVDNASEDETVSVARRRPGVIVIENKRNRGFAAAVNQGIASLPHAVALVLNPDAEPAHGIDALAEAAKTTGAAAGRLVGPDGRAQDGFNVRGFPSAWTLAFEVLGVNRLFPRNPVNRRYRVAAQGSAVQQVDQPAGAFLMVNRAAWERIGGFDESFYPVWFEDVDFCVRLRAAGYPILYVPSAEARHIGGHSAARLRWDCRQLFWYGSLLRYAGKHFRPAGRRLVALAVALGCLPRALVATVASPMKQAVGVYSKVFALACLSWRSPLTGKGDTGPAVLS